MSPAGRLLAETRGTGSAVQVGWGGLTRSRFQHLHCPAPPSGGGGAGSISAAATNAKGPQHRPDTGQPRDCPAPLGQTLCGCPEALPHPGCLAWIWARGLRVPLRMTCAQHPSTDTLPRAQAIRDVRIQKPQGGQEGLKVRNQAPASPLVEASTVLVWGGHLMAQGVRDQKLGPRLQTGWGGSGFSGAAAC